MQRKLFLGLSLVAASLFLLPDGDRQVRAADAAWKAGVARVDITPQEPIWMAGYASRKKPSEGVAVPLYAKALALESADGHRAVLITADVIGYRRPVMDLIFGRITQRTGLSQQQILLNPSHTHAGPVLGFSGATGYDLQGEQEQRVNDYTVALADQLAGLAQAALADLRPATLSYGVGVANFVMNRREFVEQGVRLGVNPSGYADRTVPVLAVTSGDELRAAVFGAACHNTTLGGDNYQLGGDYAGYAQQYIEQQLSGALALFAIGCGADANPYPRGAVEHAQQHGEELGREVCRILSGKLAAVRGPLVTRLEEVPLPLTKPSRAELEAMDKGPSHLQYNARRMLKTLDDGRALLDSYSTPIAVWQFGQDLTLVALPGEVVSEFVPLIQAAIGHRKLWIAGYSNDCFGYLPTAKILKEGGYETRCLIGEAGFFAPEAQDVLVDKVREMAAAVGRPIGE